MTAKQKCFKTERKLLKSKGDDVKKHITMNYFPHSDSSS
jgi:hypothetical protein